MSDNAEIVTLVMDGGTAYVLIMLLGWTIDGVDIPEAPRDVLIHAHDEIAGQVGMASFADRSTAARMPSEGDAA